MYDHVAHFGDIFFQRKGLKYVDDYGAIFCVLLPKYKGWLMSTVQYEYIQYLVGLPTDVLEFFYLK
jgi:hypothetical protein